MVDITTAQYDNDLWGILALQQKNLRQNVPTDEQISEGFVTVEHSFEVLRKMNHAAQSIIAKNSDSEVIGYVLTMLPEFGSEVPELLQLFSSINGLEYKGNFLRNCAYYVAGQVCIDKRYRGQKILEKMYQMHRNIYSNRYPMILTSISNKNNRSLRAHLAIGFETIHIFHDYTLNEAWHILLWDWQK